MEPEISLKYMFGSTKLEEELNFAGIEPLNSICDKSCKACDIILLVHCNINLHQVQRFNSLSYLTRQFIIKDIQNS